MNHQGYNQEQAEQDLRQSIVITMIDFHADRIEELRTLAEDLTGAEMTRHLGLFLMEDAKAHAQLNEWARRWLHQPCPPQRDENGRALWVTCLRLLKRHVAAWSWHPGYWEAWCPEEPGADGDDVWTAEERLLMELIEEEVEQG